MGLGFNALNSINEYNNNLKFIDGVLFDYNQTRLISYLETKDDEHYDIPKSVEILEWRSFSRNQKIQSVTIPSSIKRIEGRRTSARAIESLCF